MFMQIIQGRVRDEQAARAAMDRWLADLEPGADGWLGGTYGITDDRMLVCCIRFESAEAARRNSERPEQGAWWSEMEQCFEGEAMFHDCEDVTLLLNGGSDDAGFVQIIQGRVTDRDKAHALNERAAEMMTKYRPDVMGATMAIDADGFFTETVFFTSEDEARVGESKELPPEVSAAMQEDMSVLTDISYLDLHHPWFASHR
ncbi:hypothetical protein [Alloactinosynnema sp. L-07]|uniref:hypothetical protein n=1 Tax=Alloactinosynnema sp. L-07 TaxID=1653480 RepID=UPI0006B45E6E|nr:hypothetical protein [Alloactinosynnema sp. L-07]